MYDYIFKICVFGDYNTGKTSFLNFLQNYNYVRQYEPTIGVEYSTKIFELKDKKTVKVTFWDCAGQERFHSVTENFFKNVAGGLLFYDVTCKESYNNILKWTNKFRKCNHENIPIVLVGNKIDKKRVISRGDACTLATELNLYYIETSVKNKINMVNTLELLIDNIYEKKEDNPNIQTIEKEKETCLLLSKQKRSTYCTNCCIC